MLWSLAIAQPLFDVLADSPDFFVARGNTRADILVFAFGLTLIPPTILFGIELLFLRSARIRRVVHVVLIGALCAALALQVMEGAVTTSTALLFVIAVLLGALGSGSADPQRPDVASAPPRPRGVPSRQAATRVSFASPVFLWYFMPAVLVALWLAPKRARNVVVAAASLLFYTWGAGEFVLMLLACVAVNFAAGRLIGEPGQGRPQHQRRLLLAAVVVFDLSVLVVWKYGSFGLNQVADVANAFGADFGAVAAIALPIGISFFTFHNISYVVDVYRGVRAPQTKPLQFLTYIVMFPQLVAGPIVRYHEIADQLPADQPRDRMEDFAAGFPRFALGLFKKVVIADSIAPIADSAFALPDGGVTTTAAWLGTFAFTLQIYFDFSGYSDMAIGLGKMLGFRLPENFNRPYSAVSITDFWRRWHMSLSRWFRDYLYIPLGRQPRLRGEHLPQPDHRLPARRALARGRMDVHPVGRLPRRPC